MDVMQGLNLGPSERIIWVDMEMTGLDPETCHILEVACIITDANLNVLAKGPELVIHQSKQILDSMNEWCKVHHTQSGLTAASLGSRVMLKDAENSLLSFVQKHTPPGRCPLAGSSVYMDKYFMLKYMPRFAAHFHYRIIDVSTIHELARRWYPEFAMIQDQKKKKSHRAMNDILQSLCLLRYYRKNLFLKRC